MTLQDAQDHVIAAVCVMGVPPMKRERPKYFSDEKQGAAVSSPEKMDRDRKYKLIVRDLNDAANLLDDAGRNADADAIDDAARAVPCPLNADLDTAAWKIHSVWPQVKDSAPAAARALASATRRILECVPGLSEDFTDIAGYQ